MKQLWLLVGGNGVGKSTFYQQALKPLGMPFINADEIAKEMYPDDPESNSYNAAKLAENIRMQQLQEGKSFCFETVFSHPSKIDFIAKAKAMGYKIILVVIHIHPSSLNIARVAQRIADGGHSVPEEKIINRIPRVLANIAKAIPLCDDVRVLDNSRLDNPFKPVLTIQRSIRTEHQSPLPQWAQDF
ncbi:MAG: AAA family ATPase [Oleispira sp.]|nr:AAA family ATPase [Oleispira sp.]